MIRVVKPTKVKIAEGVELEIPKIEVVQEQIFGMMSSVFKASYVSRVFWLTMMLVLLGLAYVYYAVRRGR